MRLSGDVYTTYCYKEVNNMSHVLMWSFHPVQCCLWWTQARGTAECVRVCACMCVSACLRFQGALWAAIRGKQEAHHCRRKENPSSGGLVEREAGETAVGGGWSAGRFMSGKEGSFGEADPDFVRVIWPHLVRMQTRDMCNLWLQINC